MKKLIYAGIGSRETPDEICDEMYALAKFMADEGWLLRSGAADGADSAFEAGSVSGHGESQIILPWRKFNGSSSILILPEDGPIFDEAMAIAETVHRGWSFLQVPVKRLHARNVLQILGPDLESPVKLVICWTEGGKAVGGTATGIKLAQQRGIPVLNMALGFYFPGPTRPEPWEEPKLKF